MFTRRKFFSGAAALIGGSALFKRIAQGAEVVAAQSPAPASLNGAYPPVVTPNGSSLPWKMVDGVKEFHLTAEPVKREFAPGMLVNCWGYNGQTPGPTLEAVEGDRVRILVTNHLPEPTSVHWHGFILPNGMDGVGGLTQKHIPPGETYAYEFTLKQHGVQMYHPHSDELVQMAMGMQGIFVIHPKDGYKPTVDRFWVVGTDGGELPDGGRWPEVTVNAPRGTTRTVEFVADNPGDWAFHCHKNHHAMNVMNHEIANLIGVNQEGVSDKLRSLVPGYMAMGSDGMHEMSEMNMGGPKNTLPMMTGTGQFGPISMGGMFTVLKVRDGMSSFEDPGWYRHPDGTVATVASA